MEILLIKTERNSQSWNEFEIFVLVIICWKKLSEWDEIFSGGVFLRGGGLIKKDILFTSNLMR